MSIVKTSYLATSALALALSLSSLAQAQSSSIGVNAAVKGDVTVATAEQAAKQAVVKDEVFLGQMINSKKLSGLQIMLKDQTVFTVGAECELTIDKFVYDPNKNNNSMVANVAKGTFRFMSGNISKSGANAVSVNTPTASMGIRGTMVEGIIGTNAIQIAQASGAIPAGTALDTNGATLFVLRGPGPNNMGTNTNGEISVTSGNHTVIVSGSNRAVFIPFAGAAPIVFNLPTVAFQNFSQTLRTVPTGPESYGVFEIDSHFSGRPQPGPGANTGGGIGGSGLGAGNIIVGLGVIGGGAWAVAEIIDNDDDDDSNIRPSSP